jgi:mono/diheme cytochrome c family protein
MKKVSLSLLMLVFLANCKSTKETASATPAPAVYAPSEAQLKMALSRWPGATPNELVEGHKIYTTQCNRCHGNFPVEQFTEKKWLHEVDEMAPKASLSPEEKTKLTKYLLSMRDTKVSPAQN